MRIDFLFSVMFYYSSYFLFPFVIFSVMFSFSCYVLFLYVLNGNQNPKWKKIVNCLSNN